MSRLIRFTGKGPFELKPQTHSVYLCQCGLSRNQPFCDGSHVQTRAEKDGDLCIYSEVTQQVVATFADDMKSLVNTGKLGGTQAT